MSWNAVDNSAASGNLVVGKVVVRGRFVLFLVSHLRLRASIVNWTFNERFAVEHQVMQAICRDVARGALLPGDAVPAPHALAQERLLNPRRVESAYVKLVEAGLLRFGETVLRTGTGAAMNGGSASSTAQPIAEPVPVFKVAEGAQQRARDCLLRWAKEELSDLVNGLRRAGLTAEELRNLLREMGNA
jgi:DNA-binding transcriptional regulator YhcF (GntR family)